MLLFWCLVMTLRAFGQLPEFTGKKSSSHPLSPNTWLPNQFQMPFTCQCYPVKVFSFYCFSIWHLRHIFNKPENVKNIFSAIHPHNAQGLSLDRDNYCITHPPLFVCHQRYDLCNGFHWPKPDADKVSILVTSKRVFIFPSPCWKKKQTSGHCNKSVNLLNLLKFFPCFLSPFV